jgi:hypothetical protein
LAASLAPANLLASSLLGVHAEGHAGAGLDTQHLDIVFETGGDYRIIPAVAHD